MPKSNDSKIIELIFVMFILFLTKQYSTTTG